MYTDITLSHGVLPSVVDLVCFTAIVLRVLLLQRYKALLLSVENIRPELLRTLPRINQFIYAHISCIHIPARTHLRV